MKVRHLAIVSIVAAFSLLAFVFSTWMNPFNIEQTKQITHHEQFVCAVPTSSSVYIAEVKPKLAGFGSAVVPTCAALLLLPQQKNVGSFDQRQIAVNESPRPLWLLHRSLLI
jgi:hypothetical protein